MAIIDGKTGRDVTDEHYAHHRISETARQSYQRACATANAKPSGNPGRNLRAEGNVIGTVISDPLAIREALKHDK